MLGEDVTEEVEEESVEEGEAEGEAAGAVWLYVVKRTRSKRTWCKRWSSR